MRILSIVTSPRKERSASIAIIDSFLFAYQEKIKGLVVDTLDVWTESLPEFGLKQLIDLACQRNMLFTFDGKDYGPALNIDKAFVAYVRGQSEEAGFQTGPPPGFEYVAKYIEFWLHFIGVRSITTMTVEHTWDGRAIDMIDAGKKQAAELAKQF